MNRLVREEITPPSRAEEVPARQMDRFTGFTCPECRGPLYENGQPPEFRCRVGHVLSLKGLFEEHTSTQERKLYEAIVALEEGADLAQRVAVSGYGAEEEEELRKEAEQLRRNAGIIRKLIEERAMPQTD